jgi:uncharacterized damage-inducible protein DinB
MNTPQQISKHLRAVYNGGNWTGVNLKETLAGITCQQATTKVHSFNTIATLLYHMNYYVEGIIKVLRGGPLDISDKYSFDHPPVTSQQDWEKLREKVFADAETLAILIEQLPETKLGETFTDERYGNYYRNLHGVIEHVHYHLGQIALIKKLV